MNSPRLLESREPSQVERLFRQLVREWLWVSLVLLPLTALLSYRLQINLNDSSGPKRASVSVPGGLCSRSVAVAPAPGALADVDWHAQYAADQRRSRGVEQMVVPDPSAAEHATGVFDLELAAAQCGVEVFWLGAGATGQRTQSISGTPPHTVSERGSLAEASDGA